MEVEQNKESASDELWSAVMNTDVQAHGNQGKKWRIVSKNENACDSCKDTGACALIRCGHEKCPREYHLDCAFHQGGLLMDDNGVLSVFCDAHFKPILFCSCKEVYNENKPMIFCDECCDWFHYGCEGVSGAVDSSKAYICKGCREFKKQGRTVSKATKDKNTIKEQRSFFQQNGSKAIGLLSELEGGLCPIVDEITSIGKSQYSIKDISDAKDVLFAPPFNAISTTNSMDEQATELLVSLGVMPIIEKWRNLLNDYLINYQKFNEKIKKNYNLYLNQLKIEFTNNQITIIKNITNELKTLSIEATRVLIGIPVDLQGFYTFSDCIYWIEEFLQV